MLFAQLSDGGMLAGVGTVLVTLSGLVVWLVRSWIEQGSRREEVLNNRLLALEKFNTESLVSLVGSCRGAVEKNTEIVTELIATIKSHPCFWTPEKQADILATYFKSASQGKL